MGKSYAHPLLVLKTLPNRLEIVRVGISASQSVGSAVDRNRAKRRIRYCLEEAIPRIPPGWDLVFLARQAVVEVPFPELRKAVGALLVQAGLQGMFT
jgi:ribonuclease P protein component